MDLALVVIEVYSFIKLVVIEVYSFIKLVVIEVYSFIKLVVIEVYTFIKLVPGMLLASFKLFHKCLNEMKSPMLRPYINNVYLIVV